jgi:hypothetical protein
MAGKGIVNDPTKWEPVVQRKTVSIQRLYRLVLAHNEIAKSMRWQAAWRD